MPGSVENAPAARAAPAKDYSQFNNPIVGDGNENHGYIWQFGNAFIEMKRQVRQKMIIFLYVPLCLFGAALALIGPARGDKALESAAGKHKLRGESSLKSYYVRSGMIDCGGQIVSLISACFKDEDGDYVPYCSSQMLVFSNPSDHKTQAHLYEHAFKSGTPDYMVSLGCQKSANGFIVIVQGTNFSNCGTCEWIDVFGSLGRFIGTNGDRSRDRSVPFKALDPQFAKSIYATKDLTSMTVDR